MEYIIDVPDRHSVCADCDRNPCVEVGCEAAPIVFTGRMESIVRCRDCTQYVDYGDYAENIPYCVDLSMHVREDGFCAWGERRTNEQR